MLSFTSWSQYLLAFGLLGLAYYATVGWLYFRKEITALFIKRKTLIKAEAPDNGTSSSPLIQQYHTAETIKRDLKELFASLPVSLSPAQLSSYCRENIKDLPVITDPGLQAAVANIFSQLVKSRYDVLPDESAIKSLWI